MIRANNPHKNVIKGRYKVTENSLYFFQTLHYYILRTDTYINGLNLSKLFKQVG